MKILENGIYRELTAEELATIEELAQRAEQEYWASISYADAVVNEIRKKYDINAELAIQRQEKDKPEEYAEYYAYCEACKALVKSKKGV